MESAAGVGEAFSQDIRLPSALPFEEEPPAELAAVMERFGVPAVSVALVVEGRVAGARAWGVRESENGDAATPQTLFQAGSISKPVAAMCALRLVAAAGLELDADVNELLRSWKVPANPGWQPRVTVRQLLGHTAGLTVHGFPGYPRGEKAPSLVGVLDGEGNTPPVRVSTIPGLQFSYSGGGYCALQQLLIDVTGQSFPDLARELVLDPFGMDDSTYEEPLPEQLWPRAASGHRQGGAPVAGCWHVYPEMAAGGLWTTPTDLARFLIAIQDAKSGAADALLPQELTEAMLTPQAPNVSYGLGLQLEGEGDAFQFGHGGDDQGFNAWAGAYAHVGLGAVVMTNSDVGWMLLGPIRDAIARAHGWPGSWPPAPETGQPRLELDAYVGVYLTDEGRAIGVERSETGLVLGLPAQDAIELYAAGGDEWFARVVKARVAFVSGEDGRPERLVLSQDAEYVQDVEARRAR